MGLTCQQNEPEATVCNDQLLSQPASYQSLITALPDYVINGLTKRPTPEGALGRNVSGYFHVRFQLDIGFLAANAVRFSNEAALEGFVLATEYSFQRQQPAGDFELVIPASLQSQPRPTTGDLASGTSFFLSALGSSLVLLNQSPWFINRQNDVLKNRLNALTPKFQLALNYLKSQTQVLKDYDRAAPNRLLFDALAFYATGLFLNDADAKTIGLEFIRLALAQQDPAGYFIEGGGYDSSYNGVSTRLGLVLLAILPKDSPQYAPVQKALGCAIPWQAARVNSSGEISLQGNTRVFPGGEQFLGEEKQVAWIDTLLTFYFTAAFSADTSYETLAKRVESFYQ
jgi:hypothetical protein